jgi:TatD DNase family protein
MIDIGANLASAAFTPDLPAVLARAHAAGVTSIVATGTSLAASIAVAKLAATRHPMPLFFTSGLHPHVASTATLDALATIERLAANEACVAVGETGLDYDRMLSTKDEQQASFAAHLDIAKRVKKPLFLHCRDAFDDMHAMLVPHCGPAVIHCFTGTRSQARAWLDLGYDLGITGWLTQDARAADLQDAINFIPLDRLHIETDAPYLLPSTAVREAPMVKTMTGWRCEPMHLALVLASVAHYKKMHPLALAEILKTNGKRLFGDRLI